MGSKCLMEIVNKVCTKCDEEKGISEFYKDVSSKDGVTSCCAECKRVLSNTPEAKAQRKAYKKKNWPSIKVVRKAYRENNKEDIQAKAQAYNKEHKEEQKAYRVAYRQSERGKLTRAAGKRKRRALKAGVSENFSKEDEIEILNKFNHQCFNCGITSEDHKAKHNQRIHIDHLYPLSEGNALTTTNAIVLCRSCNSSKHNKNPSEFFTIKQLHELRKKGLF